MQLITNNPYRTLGVLAGATIREIIRQANTIKKFLTAGQDPPCDYSFFVLDKLNRNMESVDTAVAKLNLDTDKMTAALFWFYKGNDSTDEPAFDALKAGNVNGALQIWEKLVFAEAKGDDIKRWNRITEKNYTAFHNYFVVFFLNNNPDTKKTSNAIEAQLKFLESNFCTSFVVQVTDRTFKTTAKDLQLLFLGEIVREIEQKTINITLVQLVSILDNYNSVRQDFIKNFFPKFTVKISAEIENARKNAEDKANAAKRGEALFKQTKEDLEQLKIIFGEQDYTYFNIADKLANEILQCGMDHFEYFKDTDVNPYERSMKLLDLANSLAVGNVAKQRCRENTSIVQQWMKKKNKNIFQQYHIKFP